MRQLKQLLFGTLEFCAALLVVVFALLIPKRRRLLLWGPVPIISNKYWSAALEEGGWPSKTLMAGYYGSINRRGDFDLLFDDVVPRWVVPAGLRRILAPAAAVAYTLRNARVVHLPFSGGALGRIPGLWRMEAAVYRRAGIRTIVVPFGGDAYLYSRIIDPSLRNGLLLNYPGAARRERELAERVDYWNRNADVVICGPMIDGLGRWDITTPQAVCIDVRLWTPKQEYSANDGRRGPVHIIHTPNHRGFKGTEYLLHAVEELRREGFQIELRLLEGVPNEEVRRLMPQADILAEQFIATAYAMSGIEGMASGLPVLANLEHEAYTRVYRRYAFLDECPILSTTPETLTQNLRVLVANPTLREELGRAGRAYAEKYHSFETAQYLFGSIYEKVVDGRDVPLMNLFHPLLSTFNRRRPPVRHPLTNSRLSPDVHS